MKPPAVGSGSQLRSAAIAGVVGALLLAGCSPAAPAPDADDAAAPTSEQARPQPAPRNGAYHPDKGTAYRTVNSFGGIREAARTKHRWIDIDSQQCADPTTGRPVAVAAHWPRVTREFDDPALPLPTDLQWPALLCDRLEGLRGHPPHTQRVHLMTAMVRRVAREEGLAIEWETKPHSPAFQRPAIFRPVLRVAAELGVEIVVKTQVKSGRARALRIMRAAKKAGARTMLLNTGRPSIGLTPAEQSYLDYVRGDWHTI